MSTTTTTTTTTLEQTSTTTMMTTTTVALPHVPRLAPAMFGKEFFKVELLVGDDNAVLLPFRQKTPSEELAIHTYVAAVGEPFRIRVTLDKPRREGALFGARVYIDSFLETGIEKYEKVYKKCKEEVNDDGDDDDRTTTDDDGTIDMATPNHFFWIGPGETSYTIEGFYSSKTESNQFVFEETPLRKRSRRDVDGNVADAEQQIMSCGCIRIAFARVERMQEEDAKSRNLRKRPKQFSVDPALEGKCSVSVKPGKRVKDSSSNRSLVVDKTAILSTNIIFEQRIKYKSFEGHLVDNVLSLEAGRLDFYKAMPLSCLLNVKLRTRAIMTFLNQVRESRNNVTTQGVLLEQPQQSSNTSETAEDLLSTNNFIRVEDLLRFICDNLSPAGSYNLCVGKPKPGNYGEGSIQKHTDNLELKLQDLAKKEKGLVNFLMEAPHSYEMKRIDTSSSSSSSRNDPKDDNDEKYEVRVSIIQVDDDDTSVDGDYSSEAAARAAATTEDMYL